MSDYQQLYETSAVNTGGHEGLSYLEDGSFEIKNQHLKLWAVRAKVKILNNYLH